jgi:hypothetical protein
MPIEGSVDTLAVTRALTLVSASFLLLAALVGSSGSAPVVFDFLAGPAFLAFVCSGVTWIGLRERERGEPARHGRLWALGAVLSFTGLGWSWTGDAPRVLSPGVCFLGAVVCAVGAVVSARRARHADPRERAVARAAAWVAVLLLLIPVFLFGLLILLLTTSDSPFFM